MFLSKFIGDKAFYKKVLALAVPIMIQQGITNFVSMVDNIMVGRIGTEQMTAVAIVNQIIFVFNLCVFGATAGVGIFTAQFFGKGDIKGIKNTFRLKLIFVLIITLLCITLFLTCSDFLINSFMHDADDGVDILLATKEAHKYLKIIILGLIPFAVTMVYSGTLRETQKPMIPLISGIIAVFVNLSLNYILIFGKLGFPRLGVEGAAIATIVSRYVEAIIVIAFTHIKCKENPYIIGVYKNFRVPLDIVKRVLPKAIPLLLNEGLWALGMTLLTQCYSLRGLAVVAAANICSTITNVFIISLHAFGDSISIIVGGLLGAGKIKEAKETDTKLIGFSFIVSVGVGIIMVLTSPYYPRIYNAVDIAKQLATYFIICQGIYMPLNSIINSCYFTLRCGGKTLITFLFDSVYMLCICVTFTFILAKFTSLSIVTVYALSLAIEVFKAIIGSILVKKGVWAHNLVTNTD